MEHRNKGVQGPKHKRKDRTERVLIGGRFILVILKTTGAFV
jgi:hypothetical protein